MPNSKQAEDYNRYLLISGFSGAISAAIKTSVSAVFFYSGLSGWLTLIDAGSIIYRTTNFPLDFPHLLLAMISHVLWGSILAVGLGFLYYLVGRKNYLLIGGVYGFFIWITVLNFLSTISSQEELPALDASSVAVSLTAHIFWGLLTGFLIIKLLSRSEHKR